MSGPQAEYPGQGSLLQQPPGAGLRGPGPRGPGDARQGGGGAGDCHHPAHPGLGALRVIFTFLFNFISISADLSMGLNRQSLKRPPPTTPGLSICLRMSGSTWKHSEW